ncbi:hypothetical protein SEA_NEPTUNE_59 [Microbacterium phage Neptune]|nr:hypothetical protein SEA_NEPTUNE_59 [Microbacterium phage Neptune]
MEYSRFYDKGKDPEMMNLQELINAAKGDREAAIAYEGNRVEFENEVWYEMAIWEDGKLSFEWWAELEGDAVYYDQSHIPAEDRIAEIDEAIAKRSE